MNRILLILLLSSPGAVLAGESMAAPDGSECAEAHAGPVAGESTTPRKAEQGIRGGDAGTIPGAKAGPDMTDHLRTPSWRSYLPGMLR